MIKLSILKNGVITNQAQFLTQPELNTWLEQEENNNSFGRKAGFYPLSQLSQEELAQEISRQTVDAEGKALMEPLVEIPAQYSVVIEDITAQVEAENLKRSQKKKDRDDRIMTLKGLNIDGMSTNAQFKAVLKLVVAEILKDEL